MNESESKYALVFGASGLIGKFLTEQLINDKRYKKIIIFVRTKQKLVSPQVEQLILEPENLEQYADLFKNNHVFCCIGSTRKKAGSNKNFFKIDHNLVEKIAQVSSHQNAESFVVVSSIGASAESGNFYLRTKGLMEQSIKTFQFSNISIMRPSILLGMRTESRFFEEIGKKISVMTAPLLTGKFRKYRPIHANDVAKAMIMAAFRGKGIFTFESDEIEKLTNAKIRK
ncbi:MAG: NAD(P)H-binding protein [Lentimicrobium sp.]|nr:NAD(P)H-binding protein [Lentimicrobium sp.]